MVSNYTRHQYQTLPLAADSDVINIELSHWPMTVMSSISLATIGWGQWRIPFAIRLLAAMAMIWTWWADYCRLFVGGIILRFADEDILARFIIIGTAGHNYSCCRGYNESFNNEKYQFLTFSIREHKTAIIFIIITNPLLRFLFIERIS